MQVIKFRALCEVDSAEGTGIEEMVHFAKCECDNGLWFNPPGHIYHINEYLSPFEQFTGLTDKNGKEIFAGDILKMTIGVPHIDNSTFEVVYRDHQAVFGMINTNKKAIGLRPFCTMDDSLLRNNIYEDFNQLIEVIGNIHEQK